MSVEDVKPSPDHVFWTEFCGNFDKMAETWAIWAPGAVYVCQRACGRSKWFRFNWVNRKPSKNLRESLFLSYLCCRESLGRECGRYSVPIVENGFILAVVVRFGPRLVFALLCAIISNTKLWRVCVCCGRVPLCAEFESFQHWYLYRGISGNVSSQTRNALDTT